MTKSQTKKKTLSSGKLTGEAGSIKSMIQTNKEIDPFHVGDSLYSPIEATGPPKSMVNRNELRREVIELIPCIITFKPLFQIAHVFRHECDLKDVAISTGQLGVSG